MTGAQRKEPWWEGVSLCSLHISSEDRKSRVEEKEEDKKKVERGVERCINEGEYVILVANYGQEEEYVLAGKK